MPFTNYFQLSLSEAFSVDDWGAWLFVFCFGDPHSLECRQGWQNRPSDPDEELSLLDGVDLDLHGWWGQGGDLLCESFGDSGEHGWATAHDDVAVEFLSDVDIAFLDWLERDLVEARHLFAHVEGLEEGLRASELLGSDLEDLSIGEFVWLGDLFAFEPWIRRWLYFWPRLRSLGPHSRASPWCLWRSRSQLKRWDCCLLR